MRCERLANSAKWSPSNPTQLLPGETRIYSRNDKSICMPTLEVFYDSQHGQTAAIAEQICDIAQLSDFNATHVCLRSRGIPMDLNSQDIVIVGAPIHRGSHGILAERFVKTHLEELATKPSFFYSVSLSAAGDFESNQADARRCVRNFLEQTGWNPSANRDIRRSAQLSEIQSSGPMDDETRRQKRRSRHRRIAQLRIYRLGRGRHICSKMRRFDSQ